MFRMTQTAERGRKISAMIDRFALLLKGPEPKEKTTASNSVPAQTGSIGERMSESWRRRRRRRGLVGIGGPSIRSTWF